MEAKIDFEKVEKLAKEAGFEYTAYLDVGTMALLQEVRDMCAANTCGAYGKNKACPPECGTLEECRERVEKFHWGILVQTVGDVEDSMDIEGMLEATEAHKDRVLKFADTIRALYPGMLPLGAGGCTICKECAGPGKPCRFPEKKISSLEAYGIVVSDLCKQNGMKYYYGQDHIAYTSAFLLG